MKKMRFWLFSTTLHSYAYFCKYVSENAKVVPINAKNVSAIVEHANFCNEKNSQILLALISCKFSSFALE